MSAFMPTLEPTLRPIKLSDDAILIAMLFALDPQGLGGVHVRGGAGPVRDAWLALLREILPADAPLKKIPLHISDERLLGGLDLAATLQAGKPVLQQGVIAQADGGVLLLSMAERVSAQTVAPLCAVMDKGELALQRDGLALTQPARVGVVALDESVAEEGNHAMPHALIERLALSVDIYTVHTLSSKDNLYIRKLYSTNHSINIEALKAARLLLPKINTSDEIRQALCAAALALGIGSLRAAWFAVKVAQALAALRSDVRVSEEDAAMAARLVFSHRATQLPAQEQSQDQMDEPVNEEEPPAPQEQTNEAQPDDEQHTVNTDKPLDDVVLDAAKAAIPAGLLAQLHAMSTSFSKLTKAQSASSGGRAGELRKSQRRGRPIGVMRGEPRAGARLNVIETLRAAAPWQRIRQQEQSRAKLPAKRLHIRREDFSITRLKQRSETTTVFVVDASGSAALHRLAEAKGAVELLLADCYVRRDRVALIAFRSASAELVLPPTRSLVRAKRSLAALPGGGGTPLAAAVDAARDLAANLQRQGITPVLVFLTDGRGNIARDGTPGRVLAAEQALASAHGLRAIRVRSLLLDTSREPQPQAHALAQAMGAQYLPLPYADAKVMSKAVQVATTNVAAR